MRDSRKNQIFDNQKQCSLLEEISNSALVKMDYDPNDPYRKLYQSMIDGICQAVEVGHTVTFDNDSESLIKISQKA